MEQFKNLKDQKQKPKKKQIKVDESSESEDSDEGEENGEESQNTNEQQEDTNENSDVLLLEDQNQAPPEFPPSIPEEFKQKMEERKQRILSQNPKNYLSIDSEKHEFILENTHAREVFIEIFGDKPYKEHLSFGHFYQQTHINDTNININPWTPAPPSIYKDITSNNYDEFLEFTETSLKNTQFIHPVREKVPMGPKTCQVNSEEKVFWLTHDEILIQREFKVSKVPMADCFTQQNFYHIQQTGPTTVKIVFGFYINFVKSSMFKSLIMKSSSSENRDTWNSKFKIVISQTLKETAATRSAASTLQKKSNNNGNKKIVRISKTERMIAQNQLCIDNLNAINNEITNLDGSVHSYNDKQQEFISLQKILFCILIALVAVNFLLLFK